MEETSVIKIAVVGAAGRMGSEVLRSLHGDAIKVVGAVDRSHIGESVRELAGPKAPDILIEDKLGAVLDRTKPDVMVDFSHQAQAASHVESAAKRKIAFIIGCTGISDADIREIRQLSVEHSTPGMIVPNFALGAVLMMHFAQIAAKWLPEVEVIEMHHDRKEDAPSGTALLTAALIEESRGHRGLSRHIESIKVEGARGGLTHGVRVHSVRLPGLLAHQQVLFGAPGETLTIRHDSMDRASFMQGVKLCVERVRGLTGLTVGLDKLLF